MSVTFITPQLARSCIPRCVGIDTGGRTGNELLLKLSRSRGDLIVIGLALGFLTLNTGMDRPRHAASATGRRDHHKRRRDQRIWPAGVA